MFPPVATLPPLSLIQVSKFASIVVDSGEKVVTGSVDTGINNTSGMME
jgi:hypothetical protein